MLVSLMKTTKSINEQLQAEENSSVEVLDYSKEGAEILLSSKTEDGHIKRI